MDDYILFWHDGALGDLLISVPCILTVKELENSFNSTLIARGEQARLLTQLGVVKDFIPSNSSCLLSLFNNQSNEIIEGARAVILFTRNPNSDLSATLKRLKGSSFKIINTNPYTSNNGPRSLYIYQIEQAKSLYGIKDGRTILNRVPCERSPSNSIIIHPGSGGKRKCWPSEKFRELALALKRHFIDIRIKMIIGPTEEERIHDFRPLFDITGIELIRNAALIDIYNELKSSLLYIGNDSGISHLAAFTGIPTIIIFGPTDPAIWAPPYPWVKIVSLRNAHNLGQMQEKGPERLSPGPQTPYHQTDGTLCEGPCPLDYFNCQNRECLLNISVEDVFNAAIKTISM
ncbi:ADP-heptose--lipooligosaccharide heptosyltransferase II [Dissulfuribacter thermophilus]|uniref:ADP-heptose--lipooligosaccharide heptosyltransferase II n=1 Tax=Dissulfuribacter thermophilus TaxID=1156395 RepID=A0A1B9F8C4_9BACT|nr:glycosyltransferase family 9 protein [Dissulfuribacter thermophilus]OCC16189.1 ADP-heptose--lipooligosaccharide heptosyltransferase II [Dissulfuribacter thermophilus]